MASDARFYKDQVTTSNETTQLQYAESTEKLNESTTRHLLYKDKKKDIYSNRLGISYTVNIKKYEQTQHKDTNNRHMNIFNHNEHYHEVHLATYESTIVTLITLIFLNTRSSDHQRPDVFLRRTPPPDNDSNTTMSDISDISAAESVDTVIYPPTLARE
ncbi:hypothetical protein RhiirA1_402541 [Rhizophagus irregularis]|uniref:Uncharacterized protein n=1 Tax=Rhizophagus irregularis TaxID=588596 RepID=A0A2N0QXW6_9GLOM|nr:hypothetical protein RhiirA1_402541 [Rhizophagus irregularis]